MKKVKPLLIFDFDGTLVETEKQVWQIINKFRSKFKLKPISYEVFSQEGSGAIFPYRLISKWFSFALVWWVQREQAKDIDMMKIEYGLTKIIKVLQKNGYRMGIITSNSFNNVRRYLKTHKLSDLFEFILPVKGLDGKDAQIIKVLENNQLAPNQVIYFGDEDRDIVAGKRAGVKTVAVTWGFQAKERLAQTNPDWMIDKPNQILTICPVPWLQQILVKLGW